MTSEFVNNVCHYYLNEFYEYALQYRIESKSNFAKLKVPFWKTNMAEWSFIHWYLSMEQSTWIFEKNTIWNTFKHNLKKKYLVNLAGS